MPVNAVKRPLVVYLDSQDLSRFGDVLRGKSDAQHEKLFDLLEARKLAGDVVFPATMPLMCELLQFDPAHRETTIRKAQAVERLCGPYAMPATARLAAIEVASVAYQAGLISTAPPSEMLSADRLWFPTITDVLSDLRENMHAAAIESLKRSSVDPAIRGQVEQALAETDWSVAVADLAPTIAVEVGVPVESVGTFLVPFLRGEISALDASRGMLSGISEPAIFVNMYFERSGPMGTLPNWIRNAGFTVSRYLRAVRSRVGQLRTANEKKQGRLLVSRLRQNSRAISFELAKTAAAEFGLNDQIIEKLATDDAEASAVPSAQIAEAVIEAYMLQIIGVTAGRAKIEDSFGGDVLHAFYLPYVDLWRGDRRVSAALRQALPVYRDRISGPLTQLPKDIETKLRAA